jgi:hypothetical protein
MKVHTDEQNIHVQIGVHKVPCIRPRKKQVSMATIEKLLAFFFFLNLHPVACIQLLCTNFHRLCNNCFILLVYIKHYIFRPQWDPQVLQVFFCIQLSYCNVHIYNLYTCSS